MFVPFPPSAKEEDVGVLEIKTLHHVQVHLLLQLQLILGSQLLIKLVAKPIIGMLLQTQRQLSGNLSQPA